MLLVLNGLGFHQVALELSISDEFLLLLRANLLALLLGQVLHRNLGDLDLFEA